MKNKYAFVGLVFALFGTFSFLELVLRRMFDINLSLLNKIPFIFSPIAFFFGLIFGIFGLLAFKKDPSLGGIAISIIDIILGVIIPALFILGSIAVMSAVGSVF